MRILITGCAGYLGSVLSRYLIKEYIGFGYEVLGIDSFLYDNQYACIPSLEEKANCFRVIKADIRDIDIMKKYYGEADYIIPLAAIVGAPGCDLDIERAESTNYTAIRDMMKVISKQQRVIWPNSNSSYGQTGDTPATEETPVNPLSVYAKTKAEAEKYVLEHPNSVSLRLATLFGLSFRPRFDLLVNSFVYEMWKNKKIVIYEGHYRRNYLHILDAVRCFGIMFCDRYQGIYNVGNDTLNCTKLELAHKVKELLGYGEVVEGDGKDPDQRNYYISSQKLINDTHFRYSYTLEDGIRSIHNYLELHKTNTKLSPTYFNTYIKSEGE